MEERLRAIAASGKTQLGLRRSRSLGILPLLGQAGIELQSVHEVDHDEWEGVLSAEKRAALAEWDAFQADLEAMQKPCLHELKPDKAKANKPERLRLKPGPKAGAKNSRTQHGRLPPKSPVGRGPYEVKARGDEQQAVQPRLKTSLQRRRSNSLSVLPQLKNTAGLPVLRIWEEERGQDKLATEGAHDVFIPPRPPVRKAPGQKSSATEEMEKLLMNTDAIVNDYKVELERRKHQKKQTDTYTGQHLQAPHNLLESYKELQASLGDSKSRDIDMAMRQLSIQDVPMLNAPGALPPPPPPPFASSFTPHQQPSFQPPLYSPGCPRAGGFQNEAQMVFVDPSGLDIDLGGQPLDGLAIGSLEPLAPLEQEGYMLDDMTLPDYPQPLITQPQHRARPVRSPRQQAYIADMSPRSGGRVMHYPEPGYGEGLSMGGQEVILVQTLPPRRAQSVDPQGNLQQVRGVAAGGMGGIQTQPYMQPPPPPRRVVYAAQPRYEPLHGGSLEQLVGDGARPVLQQAPSPVQVRMQQNPNPRPVQSQRPGKAHTIGGPYMGMGGLDGSMELDINGLGGSYGSLDLDQGISMSNPPSFRHRASSGGDVMPTRQYARVARPTSPSFGFIAPDLPRMTLNQSGRNNIGVAHPVVQPTLSSIVREMLEDPDVVPPRAF